MLIQLQTLNSKIARRIFGLFVISALVPITIMAFLAFFQVSTVLTRQSEEQLWQQSKNYGMSVLAKLRYARGHLQFLALNPQSTLNAKKDTADLPAMFKAITRYDAAGTAFSLLGTIIEADAEIDDSLQSTDSRFSISADIPAKLYLNFVPPPSSSVSVRLIAELNPDYLWGSSDDLPLMTEICVLSENNRRIFCSQPVPDIVFRPESLQQHSGVLHGGWGNEDYLAVYRELYLENQFSYTKLLVVAFQPVRQALAAVDTFARWFPAVLALAIFVVILLSLSQIRRSLVPLEKLKAGADAIANRIFSSRVEVDSDDEFGELASTFNTMSSRLGRQFQALNTLAQVDQLLLFKPSSGDAAKIILEHLPAIVPCDMACITIFESTPASAYVYTCCYSDASQTLIGELSLGPTAIQAIQTFSEVSLLDIQKSPTAITYLPSLISLGARFCWLITIMQHTQLIGFIALGYRQAVALENDDKKQLSDVAGRIAVVSIAWQREQQLYHQAHHDALTELPNRYALTQVLNREIAQCQRDNTLLGLLFIDLDRFKNINDTLGHASGDDLLKQASARLQECLRSGDTVARIGGDEFNLILPRLNSPVEASKMASRVIRILSQVFVLGDEKHYISASLGIALYPYDGVTPEQLLQNADIAMYRAKQEGRGRYRFYEEEMNITINRRMQLERDLRQALPKHQFRIYYQPILDLHTNTINATEALLRWEHSEQGIIPAGRFVPLAEETDLINPIGEWSIYHTLKQYQLWQQQGLPLQRIAINLSSRQFQSPGLCDSIKALLLKTKIPARHLELEITESLFMEDMDVIFRNLNLLHRLGVRLSIDDFGTGYSALSYLKRFPIDTLKTGRSFIEQIPADRDAVALLESIIAMAKKLKKQIIIGAIENQAQMEFVRRHHCDRLQGYYLSPALTADEFAFFVEKYNAGKTEAVRLPNRQTS